MKSSKLCVLAAASLVAACSAVADEAVVVAHALPRLAPLILIPPTPTSPPLILPSPAPHGLALRAAEFERQAAELAAIAAEIRAGK